MRWWPDLPLFAKGSIADVTAVRDRLRQTAFLVPGLGIDIVDERGETPNRETFRFAGGISEFVEFLSPDVPKNWYTNNLIRSLARYHFFAVARPGKDMPVEDALSRLSAMRTESSGTPRVQDARENRTGSGERREGRGISL